MRDPGLHLAGECVSLCESPERHIKTNNSCLVIPSSLLESSIQRAGIENAFVRHPSPLPSLESPSSAASLAGFVDVPRWNADSLLRGSRLDETPDHGLNLLRTTTNTSSRTSALEL